MNVSDLLTSSSTEDSLTRTTDATTVGSVGTITADTRWNPGGFVILLIFVLIQISIWSFFILCYFSKSRRNPSTTIKPAVSIAVVDVPPEYEVAVDKSIFVPFPMDVDPPTYSDVVPDSHIVVNV